MAEELDLTNPQTIPAITTNFYKIAFINLGWEQQTINIGLRGQNNELLTFTYGGNNPENTIADRTKATQLMIALNKMNFSNISLQKRVMQQLVNDGFISGTVSGTPD